MRKKVRKMIHDYEAELINAFISKTNTYPELIDKKRENLVRRIIRMIDDARSNTWA